MVAQVEDPGEPGRRKALLGPETILRLRTRKIVDAARYGRMIGFAGRHEAEKRPSRLRGGARRRLVAGVVEAIALAAFAPAAIRVLDGNEPGGGAAHRREMRADSSGVKRAQRRPRAVDVVHAPAAEPA